MVCSPAQLAANLANSRRSTGPSSTRGKQASRKNALKHGLTGAGIVILDEDAEALDERFQAFEADLRPANDVARFLVRRAALLSVRLDRSAREEAARITLDMLEADEVEDEARALDFEELTGSFAAHPAESARKLRRTEEGIDWLLEHWRKTRLDLVERDGRRFSIDDMVRLLGLKDDSLRSSRLRVLNQGRLGNVQHLNDSDWPDLDPAQRQAAAKGELMAVTDREIAGLEEARESLDRDRLARLRSGAAARAIFNPDREPEKARRYEAANERGFFRALAKVAEINASTVAEEVMSTSVAATPESAGSCGELASFSPGEMGGANRLERLEGWHRQEARGAEKDPNEGEMEVESGGNSLRSSPCPAR